MFDPTFRFVFMVRPETRIIVLRPIGEMPTGEFINRMFEAYANIDRPWTFNRLIDFRRFDGHLTDADFDSIAARWRTMVGDHVYRAHIAIVSFEAMDRLRVPMRRPGLPQETVCHFSDYHEAMGWLTATDRSGYLAGLRPATRVRRDDGRIRIE